MFNTLNEALKVKQLDPELQSIEINAKLDEIDPVGRVLIRFEPQVVATPIDWKILWSRQEREKMTVEDREAFEEELLQIMHIQFIKNSEEVGQRYFASNVTEMTESGL